MGLIFVRNREPFLGSFSGPFFGPCKKGTYCRSRVSLTFFSGQKVTPKTVSRTGAICRLTLEQNLGSVRDEGNLGQPFFLAWAPLRAASSGDPTAPYRVAFCLQASARRQRRPAFVRTNCQWRHSRRRACALIRGKKERASVSVECFACAPASVTLARFHVLVVDVCVARVACHACGCSVLVVSRVNTRVHTHTCASTEPFVSARDGQPIVSSGLASGIVCILSFQVNG